MIKKQKGQGLIEIIFSVGVLIVVVTAVVGLIVKTTGVKLMALQRKKASEMSQIVMENLLDLKKNDPDNFWQLNDVTDPETISGYDDLLYTIDFEPVYQGNCSDVSIECANASVTVRWGNDQSLTTSRFFSKKN